MRRSPLVLRMVCALAFAAPADAATPAGSLSQLPGTAGCITEDGKSNATAGLCADGRGVNWAEPVVISPDGRFVYTYGYSSGAIAVLSRDPATGVLTQADDASACLAYNTFNALCTDSPFPAALSDTPHSLVLSPNGEFLFAAGHGVSAFRRNATTGALTPVPGPAGCVSGDGKDADGVSTCTQFSNLGNPISLAISPDARFLYAGGTHTAGLAILTVTTAGDLGLMPEPDGCFTDVSTPGCTQSRYVGGGFDIALSPDATTLYAMKHDVAILGFARDAGTGRLTPLDGPGGCVYQGGPGPLGAQPCTVGHGLDGVNTLTVSPDGTLVTAGTQPSVGGGVAVLHRDPATGLLSQSAGGAGCVNVNGGDGCGTSRMTTATYQTTFTADGRTLYAGGYASGDSAKSGVAVFDVAADGRLVQRLGAAGCYSDVGGSCTLARGILGAIGLTLAPDARFLYVSGYSDGGVATFSVGLAPSCADAGASTAFGTAVSIPLTCTDGNGDAVTLAGVDGPGHGTVAFAGSSATYTPAAGFSGADSFRYKGSDGANDSAPAKVSVTVAAAAPPPAAGKKAPLKLSLAAKPKRDRTLPYKLTFSGKLTPAAGAACSGTVVVTVKHDKKTVARKSAKLSRTCGWKAVVTFKNRKKLGAKRSGKLVASARYGGNAAMNAKTSKPLTVRYG